jgi:hypothetical protein
MKLLTGCVYVFDRHGTKLCELTHYSREKYGSYLNAYARTFGEHLPLRLVAEDVLGGYVELDRRDPN